jgi:H/ACA ribonucleoprotein complex subunit 4
VKDSAVNSIAFGAKLGVNGVTAVEESVRAGKMVAVMTQRGELVCLGTALADAKTLVSEWDGEAVKTERVVMEKGVYPKTW